MIRNLGLALTLALELGSGMGRFGCTYVESVTAWYLRNKKNDKQFNPWPCALNSITYHKASLPPSCDESASKPLPTARIVQEGRTVRIPAHSHHNERARHTVAFSAAMPMLSPSHPIPSTAGAVLKKNSPIPPSSFRKTQHLCSSSTQLNTRPTIPTTRP
jgi:hypothetical protein